MSPSTCPSIGAALGLSRSRDAARIVRRLLDDGRVGEEEIVRRRGAKIGGGRGAPPVETWLTQRAALAVILASQTELAFEAKDQLVTAMAERLEKAATPPEPSGELLVEVRALRAELAETRGLLALAQPQGAAIAAGARADVLAAQAAKDAAFLEAVRAEIVDRHGGSATARALYIAAPEAFIEAAKKYGGVRRLDARELGKILGKLAKATEGIVGERMHDNIMRWSMR